MHELLTHDPGRFMLLLGNEAIVRGAIEAGLAVSAAYPGTPSSEIGNNLFQIAQDPSSDISFEFSTNEKVAMEVTAAASAAGLRTLTSMKHVGMNVASDVLMTLAYMGIEGRHGDRLRRRLPRSTRVRTNRTAVITPGWPLFPSSNPPPPKRPRT